MTDLFVFHRKKVNNILLTGIAMANRESNQ